MADPENQSPAPGRGGTDAHRVADQSEVEAFLARPDHFGGTTPERIDTHGATLFLGPADVYKIKKAVRFPYLDFSTLEKRRAAIRHEQERGHELAPSIYLGAVPVTREADATLALGGNGEPVEWAVHMRRFDAAGELTRYAEEGRIDAALAEDLGTRIARMHEAAERRAGGAAPMGAVMRENFGSLREFPAAFPPDLVDRLERLSEDAFAGIAPMLDQRAAAGFVRLCHGDLHLGNIVVLDGEPTPFDAIEFDDDIATIDIAYDLAFLFMDMWERGLKGPANRLLCRYLEATGDDGCLSTLPLFLSIRAAIRAKVTAAAGEMDTARGYFDWAIRFLEPNPARLVAIGGLSGTGKTTVARALAPFIGPAPGAVLIRTDATRKALAGVAETEKLPPSAYTKEASERVYAAVRDRAARVLGAGHAAIVDAVSAREAEREAVAGVAAKAGVDFDGIWLEAPKTVLLERVAARTGDASDANAAVVERQLAYDPGRIDWSRVDAAGTPGEVARRAAKVLGVEVD